MTNNELAKELRERGDVEHNQFGNALLAAADIVERAGTIDIVKDFSRVQAQAEELGRSNIELANRVMALKAERDALKEKGDQLKAERAAYKVSFDELARLTDAEVRELEHERDKAWQDVVLHGVLRNELSVILGLPAQARTREGNNKILMALVDQLDSVNQMLQKATNEKDTLAAENERLKSDIATLETRHAAVMLHTQGVVDENARLIEDIGKCHDVLGESRDSDTSELWKAFEGLLTMVDRVNRLEEENARLREALENIRDTPAFTTSPTAQALSMCQLARQALNQES